MAIDEDAELYKLHARLYFSDLARFSFVLSSPLQVYLK